MVHKLLYFFSAIVLCNTLNSQPQLTIEKIMRGEEFTGFSPANVQWDNDNKTIYFQWNPEHQKISSLYKSDLSSTKPVAVPIDEQKYIRPSGGAYNYDRSLRVFQQNGDLYLHEISTNSIRRLTHTMTLEGDAEFLGRSNELVFSANDNLFTWDLNTDAMVQQTNIQEKSTERPAKKSDRQLDWLKRDQLDIFEVLDERKTRRESLDARRDALREKKLKPFYLDGRRIIQQTLSPDRQYAVLVLMSPAAENRTTKVPDFVIESGYTEELTSRPKVGSPQPNYSLWVINLHQDTAYQVSTKELPGIYDKPLFLKDYVQKDSVWKAQYDQPRAVSFAGPIFNSTGTRALVTARSMDNKDRWILGLDVASGKLEVLDRQHDEAWIGGPGVGGWGGALGNTGWLKDDETVWFQSEESGYSHLYLLSTQTKVKRALTSGTFEILEAELSGDGTTFYVTSNREGSEQQHFYHLPVQGGEMVKITNQPGGYQTFISPDEKNLALLYSYANKPWELYIKENKPGAKETQITSSTPAEFNKYPWRDPQIITFTARDGAQVKARIYEPAKKNKNGAAIIFVHGAGYLQNVHKWWSSYYREYMFHNLLADEGYTVLDIDYRASAGYGRDWRTGIYRHMGGKDLSDQVDGAQHLVKKYGIDAKRIGIYGGSYGGFITLMGMFTTPGTFACGAGLRSVADWAHYNHGYTANILNTPAEDSLAYRRSSPIYHAEGLQGHLLMLHGMVDVNVHFQDVVRLSQRLIELGKDHWDLAVYPMEDHGFVEASSWTDEYKRIYALFSTHLGRKNLKK